MAVHVAVTSAVGDMVNEKFPDLWKLTGSGKWEAEHQKSSREVVHSIILTSDENGRVTKIKERANIVPEWQLNTSLTHICSLTSPGQDAGLSFYSPSYYCSDHMN